MLFDVVWIICYTIISIAIIIGYINEDKVIKFENKIISKFKKER